MSLQVHGIGSHGKTLITKQLRRGKVLEFFANLPACLVGIEACPSAHHWAREISRLGHEVRLISKTLANSQTHRPSGRDLQTFAGPEVAGAAGAALIDLEATEADEVHRLALADGTFDPASAARPIASTMAFGWAGVGGDAFDQVSEKHIKPPVTERPSRR